MVEAHGDLTSDTVTLAPTCQSVAVDSSPLQPLHLPFRTADLPGVGGRVRATDDDFAVEEIPAYPPSGEGDHVFVHIEKRGLTTPAAAQLLAAIARVSSRDVGWAGMKDRHAVTRQWLSLPPPAKPEAVLGVAEGGLTVLAAMRHRHKLRTGHLKGNRFGLVIRDVGDEIVAADRARSILALLAAGPGAPNWYGEQRFGARGDNATVGLDILRRGGTGGGSPKHKRMLVSALQSHLFNQWLCERMADEMYGTVLAGDLVQKTTSGGMFVSEDTTTDQARLDTGELVITGPMFGASMRSPPAGSPAHVREARLLDAIGLGPADFARLGSIANGTRRPAAMELGGPEVVVAGPGAIRVTFSLPAGSYATTVLREIQKADDSVGREPDSAGEAARGASDTEDPMSDPDA
jgi:tRNA pseudouridine13 synthase